MKTGKKLTALLLAFLIILPFSISSVSAAQATSQSAIIEANTNEENIEDAENSANENYNADLGHGIGSEAGINNESFTPDDKNTATKKSSENTANQANSKIEHNIDNIANDENATSENTTSKNTPSEYTDDKSTDDKINHDDSSTIDPANDETEGGNGNNSSDNIPLPENSLDNSSVFEPDSSATNIADEKTSSLENNNLINKQDKQNHADKVNNEPGINNNANSESAVNNANAESNAENSTNAESNINAESNVNDVAEDINSQNKIDFIDNTEIIINFKPENGENDFILTAMGEEPTLSPPPAPALPTGATAFIGWFSTENPNGSAFDFNSEKIYNGLTLFAKYSYSVLVTYLNNDGGVLETATIEKGGLIPLPKSQPQALENQVLKHWYVKGENPLQAINLGQATTENAITLCPYFESLNNAALAYEEKYTITYTAQYGYSGVLPVDSNEYLENSSAVIQGTTATFGNKRFSGWVAENKNNKGEIFHSGNTITVTENIILTARFVPQNSLTEVIYKANDTNAAPQQLNINVEASEGFTTASAEVFVCEGKALIGWNTSNADALKGKVQFACGQKLEPKDIHPIVPGYDKKLVLYGVWLESEFIDVTFYCGAGSFEEPQASHITLQAKRNIALNNPENNITPPIVNAPDGYYFNGWSPEFNPTACYNKNIEFTAQFGSKTNLEISFTSKEKVYDGDAISYDKPYISSGSLKKGHNLTIVENGDYNLVHATANAVDYIFSWQILDDKNKDVSIEYNVALINGTLKINPAPITVTATSINITRGDEFNDALLGYLLSASPVKNDNLNLNVLYTVESFTSTLIAGVYEINIQNSSWSNPDYLLTFINAKLNIENAWRVEYDFNGGQLNNEAFAYSQFYTDSKTPHEIEKTNVPKWDGYEFIGWHTDASNPKAPKYPYENNNDVLYPAKQKTDIKLYAAWAIENTKDENGKHRFDAPPVNIIYDGEPHSLQIFDNGSIIDDSKYNINFIGIANNIFQNANDAPISIKINIIDKGNNAQLKEPIETNVHIKPRKIILDAGSPTAVYSGEPISGTTSLVLANEDGINNLGLAPNHIITNGTMAYYGEDAGNYNMLINDAPLVQDGSFNDVPMANYDISYTGDKFVITKAQLDFTINSFSHVSGTPRQNGENGTVNMLFMSYNKNQLKGKDANLTEPEVFALLSHIPEIKENYDYNSKKTGEYPINAQSTPTAENYEVSITPGMITVTAANQGGNDGNQGGNDGNQGGNNGNQGGNDGNQDGNNGNQGGNNGNQGGNNNQESNSNNNGSNSYIDNKTPAMSSENTNIPPIAMGDSGQISNAAPTENNPLINASNNSEPSTATAASPSSQTGTATAPATRSAAPAASTPTLITPSAENASTLANVPTTVESTNNAAKSNDKTVKDNTLKEEELEDEEIPLAGIENFNNGPDSLAYDKPATLFGGTTWSILNLLILIIACIFIIIAFASSQKQPRNENAAEAHNANINYAFIFKGLSVVSGLIIPFIFFLTQTLEGKMVIADKITPLLSVLLVFQFITFALMRYMHKHREQQTEKNINR